MVFENSSKENSGIDSRGTERPLITSFIADFLEI
jgi:hypothetical protein